MATEASELTVIVPTYNERENVERVILALEKVLAGLRWEVLFVDDDSPDGTADRVRELSLSDTRIRCLQRLGRRGLSSACIEGVMASSSPYVAIMDSDLQHDEALLPKMLELLKPGQADLVNGSRYMAGGDSSQGLNRLRSLYSRFATVLAGSILKVKVTDPMSGFFMFRRESLAPVIRRASGKGFKILLDLLSSAKDSGLRVQELPYEMRSRAVGESKLDSQVLWEYVVLLADKLIGRYIPVRFILFAGVGLTGVLVHLAVLGLIHRVMGEGFLMAQIAATMIAMTSNFILNNIFTYHDMRLTGRGFVLGLLSFYLACSLGAAINFLVSNNLFESGFVWWLAGITGAVVGAVWNYSMTSIFTWSKKK